jgi:hypothetical protein
MDDARKTTTLPRSTEAVMDGLRKSYESKRNSPLDSDYQRAIFRVESEPWLRHMRGPLAFS